MAIWNWKSKSDERVPELGRGESPKQMTDRAWGDASRAIVFYLEFREKYNVPFTPERWRDDFALGFREGLGQLHFTILNDTPNSSDALFDWKLAVIRGDEALEEAWMIAVKDNGGFTKRAEEGMEAALLLETWRLKKECIRGGLDYIERYERDYRQRHPDATQFNIDHSLLLQHFVVPLIDADKVVHPILKNL